MTAKYTDADLERARQYLVATESDGPEVSERAWLAQLIAQVRAEERERCAKEVERYPIHGGFNLRNAEAIERRDMAMAERIRSGE